MALERLPTIQDEGLYQQSSASPFLQFGADAKPVQVSEPTANLNAPSDVMDGEQERMQELDRMLQDAQSRADIAEREAYDKAYAVGEKSGMALGEKRAEQTLEQMTQVLKKAELELADMDVLCREAVLDIAEAVVKQVLGDLGEQQHALLVQAAERAAFQFPDLSGLVVLVNPNDMQIFEALLAASNLSESRIRAQQDVQEGSCRLMSSQQDVLVDPNQALREKFDALRQQFLV